MLAPLERPDDAGDAPRVRAGDGVARQALHAARVAREALEQWPLLAVRRLGRRRRARPRKLFLRGRLRQQRAVAARRAPGRGLLRRRGTRVIWWRRRRVDVDVVGRSPFMSISQSLGEARRRFLDVGSRARPELQRIHNRPRPGAVERGPEGFRILVVVGLRAAVHETRAEPKGRRRLVIIVQPFTFGAEVLRPEGEGESQVRDRRPSIIRARSVQFRIVANEDVTHTII